MPAKKAVASKATKSVKASRKKASKKAPKKVAGAKSKLAKKTVKKKAAKKKIATLAFTYKRRVIDKVTGKVRIVVVTVPARIQASAKKSPKKKAAKRDYSDRSGELLGTSSGSNRIDAHKKDKKNKGSQSQANQPTSNNTGPRRA